MSIFFDGWESIGRVLVSGITVYLALVALLRTSGKRTLAKLNAFDLIVTIALGSTLSSVMLSKDVPVATGLAGIALLVGMQYALAALSVRSDAVRRATRSEPALLVRGGVLLREAMRAERITESEILQAVRNNGDFRLEGVTAVILETDGSLSVVASGERSGREHE